jgi:hypothetical protein
MTPLWDKCPLYIQHSMTSGSAHFVQRCCERAAFRWQDTSAGQGTISISLFPR